MISINELSYVDRNIYSSICELMKQLSDDPCIMTIDDLEKIISTKNTLLFIAVNESNSIVGMLSLIYIRKLAGFSVRIEDLVVDNNSRKLGIGKQLMHHAIDISKKMGVKSIDLTSRSSRVSANNLYQSLGFELHETNVYTLNLFINS